ncbi:MAG: hypothetical protein ACJAUP_001756, partial [Cellvibrionaceae bacterium]
PQRKRHRETACGNVDRDWALNKNAEQSAG